MTDGYRPGRFDSFEEAYNGGRADALAATDDNHEDEDEGFSFEDIEAMSPDKLNANWDDPGFQEQYAKAMAAGRKGERR